MNGFDDKTGEIEMTVEERQARKAGLEAELKALKAQEPPLIDTRDGIAAGVGALVGVAATLVWEAFF